MAEADMDLEPRMTRAGYRIGRPTRFTPEVRTKIINALKGGVPKNIACASAGVDYSTFAKWIQRGERQTRGSFFDFFQDVKKAEADSIVRNVTVIQKAGMGGTVLETSTTTHPDGRVTVTEKKSAPSWQASAWWLERKYPGEWARREHVEHTAPGGPIATTNLIVIEDKVGRGDHSTIELDEAQFTKD